MITRSMSQSVQNAIKLSHDASRNVFRALGAEGKELGHLEYKFIPPSTVDFYHTFTEPQEQGRGIAAKLVTAGL
jgi:predicted GNAT family acetyltransferase